MKNKADSTFHRFLTDLLKRDKGYKVPEGYYVIRPGAIREAFDAGWHGAMQALHDNLLNTFDPIQGRELKKPDRRKTPRGGPHRRRGDKRKAALKKKK